MSQTTRDRIRALIVQFPGLHLREIARQMDMSLALIQYHIPGLVKDGLIEIAEEDGTQRLFPATQVNDRAALACLRDRHRLHICLRLLEVGPMRHTDLGQATGLGKSTLSFHLKRLQKAKIVEKVEQTYQLVSPDKTRALISEHRPTPDVIDNFANIWGDLYG